MFVSSVQFIVLGRYEEIIQKIIIYAARHVHDWSSELNQSNQSIIFDNIKYFIEQFSNHFQFDTQHRHTYLTT